MNRTWTGLLLLVVSGCAIGQERFLDTPYLRAPEHAPDHFMVAGASDAELVEPRPGNGCVSPMVDPRDGTRLLLFRSAAGLGDYDAPAGQYGLEDGELLRIECATGRPEGVVRR
ncbi:MAG: hypothetical protein R2834_16770 [Rhodothermales bacterium]